MKALCIFSLIFPTIAAYSAKEPPCPNADASVTRPSPVDLEKMESSILALRNTNGTKLISAKEGIRSDVEDIFARDRVSTKMEQFYSLLFSISERMNPDSTDPIFMDPGDVRGILLTAGVFSDPLIPNQIAAVSVSKKKRGEPLYTISFQQDRTEVPLNRGEGFYLFRNGLCQHAQSLVFGKNFSVRVLKNKRGHTVAQDFSGVDLFGTFGNRGFIRVDIQYVSLRAVEFYRGTPNGKVTAYVSREEFEKRDHNPLLKLITKYVPDKSVQPIDW